MLQKLIICYKKLLTFKSLSRKTMKFIENFILSLQSDLKVNRLDLILKCLLAILKKFCPKVTPEEHLHIDENVSTVEPTFKR